MKTLMAFISLSNRDLAGSFTRPRHPTSPDMRWRQGPIHIRKQEPSFECLWMSLAGDKNPKK